MERRLTGLALWVLPVAFVAYLGVLLSASLPLWQVFNHDPDYYYLLNGLRLVEGLPPTDLSHPGTPAQMLVALALRLMHPAMGTEELVLAVLKDPEHHLLWATLAFYPPIALALWGLGRAMLATTGRMWPALLAQSAPFLSMLIPKFGLHAKPEPLLIVAACALVAAGLATVRAERPANRHAVALGIAMGFGIACKLQFAALGLVPLFLLDARRLFLVYPAATVAAFLVFVAPALPSADIFLEYWGRVATHSGPFGTGEAAIVDAARYPRAILKLFGSKIIMTATILAALVFLVLYVRVRRRGLLSRHKLARLLAGMVLAQIATVVMVAKQPAAHYLIPALLLTGPSLACLWCLTVPVSPARGHRRAWALVSAALVAATLPALWGQARELAQWTKEAHSFDMGRFAHCAKVHFDGASALSYALQRGDMNAQARYSPLLAQWMPRDEYTWFTNDHTWWNKSLMWWNQPVTLDEIESRHGCVVFRGHQPWTVPGQQRFHDTCAAGEEAIFTLNVRCDGSPVTQTR